MFHACVCMYIYIYVCMYVCIYVCMYVCMYVCIYTHTLTHACSRWALIGPNYSIGSEVSAGRTREEGLAIRQSCACQRGVVWGCAVQGQAGIADGASCGYMSVRSTLSVATPSPKPWTKLECNQ